MSRQNHTLGAETPRIILMRIGNVVVWFSRSYVFPTLSLYDRMTASPSHNLFAPLLLKRLILNWQCQICSWKQLIQIALRPWDLAYSKVNV